MHRFAIFAAMTHYAGRVRAIRRQVRAERDLNALPLQIRTDIGWPDLHDGRWKGGH